MAKKTAVIPVAGYGTRFFPASRVIPKALLPIFDTPGIQFVVEEAVNSGIQQLIFVISSDQDLVRQYFSGVNKVDEILKQKGMVEKVEIFSNVRFTSYSGPSRGTPLWMEWNNDITPGPFTLF